MNTDIYKMPAGVNNHAGSDDSMGISVVIPALNESAAIESTLGCLTRLRGIREVVVVDGGSSDNTVAIASRYCRVIASPPGRAVQMNTGARNVSGNVILFLHADSIVTQKGIDLLARTINNPQIVGGGFGVEFDDNSVLFRLIALCSNMRARFFKVLFGDQGIFIRLDVFRNINGFPEIPIMEDWELCRKMKSAGKIVLLPATILTSSRRWRKYGIWKTIWLMHKIKLLYVLGVSPTELKKMYSDNR